MDLRLEAVLTPVSDDLPAGPWRDAADAVELAFYETREQLQAAREITRGRRERDRGLDASEERPRVARWDQVVESCIELLSRHTKDLEAVAWLVEALVHEQGVHGVAAGLKLIRDLTIRYQGQLHPTPDDDADGPILPQLECLLALDAKTAQGELRLPLGDVAVTKVGAYTFDQARIAEAMEGASSEQRKAWLEQGYPALDHINDAIRETGASFYDDLSQGLADSSAALLDLEATLTAKKREELGDDAVVAFENIRKDLEALATFVTSARASLGEEETDAPSASLAAGARAGPTRGAPMAEPGQVTSRRDAIHGLDAVAAYYRTYEPQSPLLCVVEQAARWARLDAAQLFRQMITSGSALHVLIAQSCTGEAAHGAPDTADQKPQPPLEAEALDEGPGDGRRERPRTSLSRIAGRLQ